MMDPLADAASTFRSLKKGVIRSGPEGDSEKVGNLGIGEVFDVLEEVVIGGQKRIRMERGWVSMTAKSGKPLCVGEAAVQLFLNTVPLLQHLDEDQRAEIADVMGAEEFDPNVPIVQEGEPGEAVFFLEEGDAEAEVKGVGVVKLYQRGDFFGEMALLTDQPRRATVRAGPEGSRCLVLGRAAFDTLASGCAAILEERQRQYDEVPSAGAAAADSSDVGSDAGDDSDEDGEAALEAESKRLEAEAAAEDQRALRAERERQAAVRAEAIAKQLRSVEERRKAAAARRDEERAERALKEAERKSEQLAARAAREAERVAAAKQREEAAEERASSAAEREKASKTSKLEVAEARSLRRMESEDAARGDAEQAEAEAAHEIQQHAERKAAAEKRATAAQAKAAAEREKERAEAARKQEEAGKLQAERLAAASAEQERLDAIQKAVEEKAAAGLAEKMVAARLTGEQEAARVAAETAAEAATLDFSELLADFRNTSEGGDIDDDSACGAARGLLADLEALKQSNHNEKAEMQARVDGAHKSEERERKQLTKERDELRHAQSRVRTLETSERSLKEDIEDEQARFRRAEKEFQTKLKAAAEYGRRTGVSKGRAEMQAELIEEMDDLKEKTVESEKLASKSKAEAEVAAADRIAAGDARDDARDKAAAEVKHILQTASDEVNTVQEAAMAEVKIERAARKHADSRLRKLEQALNRIKATHQSDMEEHRADADRAAEAVRAEQDATVEDLQAELKVALAEAAAERAAREAAEAEIGFADELAVAAQDAAEEARQDTLLQAEYDARQLDAMNQALAQQEEKVAALETEQEVIEWRERQATEALTKVRASLGISSEPWTPADTSRLPQPGGPEEFVASGLESSGYGSLGRSVMSMSSSRVNAMGTPVATDYTSRSRSNTPPPEVTIQSVWDRELATRQQIQNAVVSSSEFLDAKQAREVAERAREHARTEVTEAQAEAQRREMEARRLGMEAVEAQARNQQAAMARREMEERATEVEAATQQVLGLIRSTSQANASFAGASVGTPACYQPAPGPVQPAVARMPPPAARQPSASSPGIGHAIPTSSTPLTARGTKSYSKPHGSPTPVQQYQSPYVADIDDDVASISTIESADSVESLPDIPVQGVYEIRRKGVPFTLRIENDAMRLEPYPNMSGEKTKSEVYPLYDFKSWDDERGSSLYIRTRDSPEMHLVSKDAPVIAQVRFNAVLMLFYTGFTLLSRLVSAVFLLKMILLQDLAVAVKAMVQHEVKRGTVDSILCIKRDALFVTEKGGGSTQEFPYMEMLSWQDFNTFITIRLRGGEELKLETPKSASIAEGIAEATLWTERRRTEHAQEVVEAELAHENKVADKASRKVARKAEKQQARKDRKAAKERFQSRHTGDETAEPQLKLESPAQAKKDRMAQLSAVAAQEAEAAKQEAKKTRKAKAAAAAKAKAQGSAAKISKEESKADVTKMLLQKSSGRRKAAGKTKRAKRSVAETTAEMKRLKAGRDSKSGKSASSALLQKQQEAKLAKAKADAARVEAKQQAAELEADRNDAEQEAAAEAAQAEAAFAAAEAKAKAAEARARAAARAAKAAAEEEEAALSEFDDSLDVVDTGDAGKAAAEAVEAAAAAAEKAAAAAAAEKTTAAEEAERAVEERRNLETVKRRAAEETVSAGLEAEKNELEAKWLKRGVDKETLDQKPSYVEAHDSDEAVDESASDAGDVSPRARAKTASSDLEDIPADTVLQIPEPESEPEPEPNDSNYEDWLTAGADASGSSMFGSGEDEGEDQGSSSSDEEPEPEPEPVKEKTKSKKAEAKKRELSPASAAAAAGPKDYAVEQLKKEGRYKKGAADNLVLNINQMGVKIFDGATPLDTIRYAELTNWEFNEKNKVLSIVRDLKGKKKDERGPAVSKFLCSDIEQGTEIKAEMAKVAKLMADQMEAANKEKQAAAKADKQVLNDAEEQIKMMGDRTFKCGKQDLKVGAQGVQLSEGDKVIDSVLYQQSKYTSTVATCFLGMFLTDCL